MTLTETPTAGAIASIIKATQRLNPCMELDVDVLAVTRSAVNSTAADWNAGVLTNVVADPSTGTVRLTLVAAGTLFSQVNTVSVIHSFQDSALGAEEYALDFFLDPSVAQGVHLELDSLDLHLSRMGGGLGGALVFDKSGFFRVRVAYYDQDWKLVQMGDPIDISATLIALGGGGIYKIDFTALQRRFVFAPGAQNTNTGAGFDGTNIRTLNVDTKGVSHIPNIARGLSISITPMGKGFQNAFIGCVANATAAQFDTTTFWRRATNRNCGPYNPTNQPFAGTDLGHNPDKYLTTGAVPGYGAKTVTNGTWGIARRLMEPQHAQKAASTWEQPYHVLRVKAYAASGSIVSVLDMGAVPTNPVELRLDDWQQNGTSIAYTLKGSNISSAGAWTAISANTDGSVLTGADLYRWYQLTAAFTPGPSGATKYASPALQAWSMVERVAITTYRYLKDVDSTTVADPVTAQSSIGELKLPVMNAGRQDFRDLASQLGSNYSPAFLEAHVYARNTRSGVRLFLNSYRLENRDPTFGAEEMTFVSGMDRLTIKVPVAQETFRYPAISGTAPATTVTNPSGTTYRIAPGGTPFTATALAGMRMHGVTGQCAGLDYPIQAGNTTAYFEIITGGTQTPPLSGDTFEIHSDATTRTGAVYVGADFAAVYSDLLAVQAAVPARYRGKLPPTTGRTTTYTLPAAGVKALDVLQDVALHCGGFPAWIKGRISYVDFYGPKDSMFVWGDREIVTLETPVGMDRRMPSVKVKYGYDPGTQNFTNETTYNDFDSLVGLGRANLFDTFDIPDDCCKWNDLAESKDLAGKLQNAWKSGVRLWKVKTVFCYPWLDQGDAGTILTDQYTDRRLSFSADGLTDNGTPIAGRTSSVAVIIGKNLWGNEFVVAVRGLDAVTSGSAAVATGTVAVPVVGTQPPVALITHLNTEVDDTEWDLQFSATPGSGGGGANLTWIATDKIGFVAETTFASGNASTLPFTQVVTRDLRSDRVIRVTVTDALTGLSSTARITVPSRRLEIDSSGRIQRARTWSDGGWAVKASDTAGGTIDTSVGDSRGFPINTHFNTAHHTIDDAPDGTISKKIIAARVNLGRPVIDFTEAIHAGKNQDNIPDSATRFAAVQANADHTASNTAAAIAGQGALATKGSVDLSTADVTNKTLLNIADTASRFAAVEASADHTGGHTSNDTSNVNGVAAATVQGGAARSNIALDSSGRVQRANPFSDGFYGLRASETDGSTKTLEAFNGQGSIIPAPIDAGAFSYNAGGPAAGKMWIAWTWSAFTIWNPDGTTINVPSSTALPAPPTPTVSQVAGGALGARTRFVRIGYIKNNVIYRVGAETSIAILANNLLKVTSPASVTGYDRWVPLVGTASNGEFIQVSTTFGSDYTESTGGFNATTTTPYDNTWMPGGVTAPALPNVSQSYNFYTWYDIALAIVAFASGGAIGKNFADAQAQNLNGHIPLQVGPMAGLTPAAGTTTSGGSLGGGKFG